MLFKRVDLPELKVFLPWSTVQDGVYERHDGSLEADVVTVLSSAPVKVVQNALKTFHIVEK